MNNKIFKIVLSVLISIQVICADEVLKEDEIDDLCLKPCTKIMNPVCGTDGNLFKSFNNQCLMQQYSCQTKADWVQIELEYCMAEELILARSLCEKPCPFIYLPVCGHNGKESKLFPNKCVMEVENCYLEEKYDIVKFTDCGSVIRL